MKFGATSNIRKFYLFEFLRFLSFTAPVIVLFWQENGLNMTQIMLLNAIYSISLMLFQVPCGVLADKIGRKYNLIHSMIFTSLGAFTYFMGHGFWQFAVAEFIWGLGASLGTGSDSAFLYDTLKSEKREGEFKKKIGASNAITYFGLASAAIVGGFVAARNSRLNFLLLSIAMLFALVVALTFKEPKHFRKVEKKSYFKHMTEGFREAFANKNLFFLLLFSSLFAALNEISYWAYQPYMAKSGVNVALFGIIGAAYFIFALGGSKYAHKIEEYLTPKWSLWFVVIIMTISLLFMSYWFAMFGIIFIFLQRFSAGFFYPVMQDYTHKQLASEKRATLMSVQAVSGSLLAAILGPIFGYITDILSLSTAMLISAVVFFFAFSILMIWGKK